MSYCPPFAAGCAFWAVTTAPVRGPMTGATAWATCTVRPLRLVTSTVITQRMPRLASMTGRCEAALLTVVPSQSGDWGDHVTATSAAIRADQVTQPATTDPPTTSKA